MDEATRDQVRRRAGDRCEYWRLPQEASVLTFHVDPIVAKQHMDDAQDGPQLLYLACKICFPKKSWKFARRTDRLTDSHEER